MYLVDIDEKPSPEKKKSGPEMIEISLWPGSIRPCPTDEVGAPSLVPGTWVGENFEIYLDCQSAIRVKIEPIEKNKLTSIIICHSYTCLIPSWMRDKPSSTWPLRNPQPLEHL